MIEGYFCNRREMRRPCSIEADQKSFFNPRELIRSISLAVTGSEDEIELGDFQPGRVGSSWLGTRKEQYCARAPITQPTYGALLPSLAGIDGERTVGYVEIRNGFLESYSEEDPTYEEIILRLTDTLSLKSGGTIPNCRVRIYRESEEFENPCVERSDRVRRFCWPFWKKVDLSRVIPTGWF